MPDITMCKNEKCPLKKSCYRYLAKPNSYQAYFTIEHYDKKAKTCDYYWKI